MKAARNLTIVSLLIAAVVAAFTILTPATAQTPPTELPGVGNVNENAAQRALDALAAAKLRFMTLPSVVATGLGLNANGEPVIKVFVADAGVGRISANVQGFSVVVQVSGEIVAMGAPSEIGTSAGTDELIENNGNLFCTVGTNGCTVEIGPVKLSLSNAHVFAREGSNPAPGQAVNTVVGGAGTPDLILHPGRVDLSPGCGTQAERTAAEYGALYDFVPLLFGGPLNYVDAALALPHVTAGPLGSATPADGYGYPNTVPVPVDLSLLGQDIQKYGRTTDLTKGTVTAINAMVNIGYDTGIAVFDDQIIMEELSRNPRKVLLAGGDSGSLVVTNPGRDPVALLFAGNRSGKLGIGNPIGAVLTALGATIVGEAACVVSEADTELTCNDGLDNDCDGFIDCDDGDCSAEVACGACSVGSDCNDLVACTDDTCDGGTCVFTLNDGNCPDDGVFCNGDEFCDGETDCSSAGDPCPGGTTCNEATDTCDPDLCGGNKAPCGTSADCCSGNCKSGTCRGN